MFPWTEFIIIATTHLLAVASPGPDFALVLKNSLSGTKKTGFYTAIGLGLGIAVHVSYSLLGIGLLISQSVMLFNIIKAAGAMYLIWIGIQGLRSKKNTMDASTESLESESSLLTPAQALKQGFLTNILNPKATLFFVSLFALVVSPQTAVWVKVIYGAEMAIATVAWFTLLAVVFTSKKVNSKLQRIKHIIERTMGAVLVGLGIKVLSSK